MYAVAGTTASQQTRWMSSVVIAGNGTGGGAGCNPSSATDAANARA